MKRKKVINTNRLEEDVRRMCKLRIKDLERYKTKMQIKVNRFIREYSDYIDRAIKDIGFEHEYDFYRGLPKPGDVISIEKWIKCISDLQFLINRYNMVRGSKMSTNDEYDDRVSANNVEVLMGLMNALYGDLMAYAALEYDQQYHRSILAGGDESIRKIKNDFSILLNKYFKKD